jgi:hypothetical protein
MRGLDAGDGVEKGWGCQARLMPMRMLVLKLQGTDPRDQQ